MENKAIVVRPSLSTDVSPEMAHRCAVEHTRALHGWSRRIAASSVPVVIGALVFLHYNRNEDMRIALITAAIIGGVSLMSVAVEYGYRRLTAPANVLADRLREAVKIIDGYENERMAAKDKRLQWEQDRYTATCNMLNEVQALTHRLAVVDADVAGMVIIEADRKRLWLRMQAQLFPFLQPAERAELTDHNYQADISNADPHWVSEHTKRIREQLSAWALYSPPAALEPTPWTPPAAEEKDGSIRTASEPVTDFERQWLANTQERPKPAEPDK